MASEKAYSYLTHERVRVDTATAISQILYSEYLNTRPLVLDE